MTSFQTIGLVGRVGNPKVVESVVAVQQYLSSTGVEIVLETATAPMLPSQEFEVLERSRLGSRCDLIIVVGGDGSILGVAREVAHTQVPILLVWVICYR